MKLKNKILIALGVLCALAVKPIQAQTPTFYQNTIVTSQTFLVGATNLASPYLLDVRKQGNVTLTSTLRGATTATNTYYLGWSEDGSTIITNAADCPIPWVADSASALSSQRSTNISTTGHGYLVIWGVLSTQQNTNTLKYNTKISAP